MSTEQDTNPTSQVNLKDLADLAAAVTNAERRAEIAREDRDAAIRQLLDDGASVAHITAATGLHRQRIYQVRDSR